MEQSLRGHFRCLGMQRSDDESLIVSIGRTDQPRCRAGLPCRHNGRGLLGRHARAGRRPLRRCQAMQHCRLHHRLWWCHVLRVEFDGACHRLTSRYSAVVRASGREAIRCVRSGWCPTSKSCLGRSVAPVPLRVHPYVEGSTLPSTSVMKRAPCSRFCLAKGREWSFPATRGSCSRAATRCQQSAGHVERMKGGWVEDAATRAMNCASGHERRRVVLQQAGDHKRLERVARFLWLLQTAVYVGGRVGRGKGWRLLCKTARAAQALRTAGPHAIKGTVASCVVSQTQAALPLVSVV